MARILTVDDSPSIRMLVTATLQRMERDGLVTHARQREIQLTENGSRTAEDLVRRHALAERRGPSEPRP